jgi:hypothetical protein
METVKADDCSFDSSTTISRQNAIRCYVPIRETAGRKRDAGWPQSRSLNAKGTADCAFDYRRVCGAA